MKRKFKVMFIALLSLIMAAGVLTACTTDTETDPVLQSLTVVTAPSRTVYVNGDTFEKAGLKVEAVYSVGENKDVTDDLTIPTAALVTGQEKVTVSYTEGGVTKSADIEVTVIAQAPGDADELTNIGATDLKVDATVLSNKAESHWYVSYGDENIEVTVLVKDSDIKAGSNVWNSDGVIMYLAKSQRFKNIADGTVRIIAPAKGDMNVAVYAGGEATVSTTTNIASVVKMVAFDSNYDANYSYIDGYKVVLTIPYAAVEGVTKAEKNLSIAAGLINSNGTVAAEGYDASHDTDYNKAHTYLAVTGNNVYAANEFLVLATVWGSANDILKQDGGWFTDGDDGETNFIRTGDASGHIPNRAAFLEYGDNQIYMVNESGANLYAEMEFNAVNSFDGATATADAWGKFGITIYNADGSKGVFYYVDAASTGSITNFTGTRLGYNRKVDGGWDNNADTRWKQVGDPIAPADYTGNNYARIGILRDGKTFSLYYYRNGIRELVDTIECGIGETEPAFFGIATFKININVRNYILTSDADYLTSLDWVEGAGYVESLADVYQTYPITGAKLASFFATTDVWVGGGAAVGKVGITLKGATKEMFYFIDIINANRNNNWGNHWVRNIGDEWSNVGQPVVYANLKGVSHNQHYKTIAVLKIGTAIYMYSDNVLVMYTEGEFEANEKVSISATTTGPVLRVANIDIVSGADLADKMETLGIVAKGNVEVDADLSDWTAAQKTNPKRMAMTDGRTMTVYAHTQEDGLYIGVEAIINRFDNTNTQWHLATNFEFKIANGKNNLRFASANGMYTRYRDGNDNDRDVGVAKWNATEGANSKINATLELFIPWDMIEGFDADSEYVPIGFAFKTGGETGNIWEVDTDFIYYPEGDGNLRNQRVTRNGFRQATDLVIDGSADDWDAEVLATKRTRSVEGKETEAVAFLGTDGIYIYAKITLPNAINAFTNSNDWFANPNLEFWINDKDNWAYRVLLIDGLIVGRGRIAENAYRLSNDNKTIEIEMFLPYDTLPDALDENGTTTFKIGSNGMGVGWFMPIENNVTITKDGIA